MGVSAWTASISALRNIRRCWRRFPTLPRASGPAAIARISRATAVAVIGARDASQEGLIAASEIAFDLARAGIVVVSGLARGIDSAAHRGALDGGGKTIAVLGTGIDRVYPAENDLLHERDRVERTAGHGVPARHAIRRIGIFPGAIASSAASRKAVVVVEAQEKSGSLITARLAADQGRDVMAVPGHDRRRPQPRRQRFVEGWGKARGVCGRYPSRAGIGIDCHAGAGGAEAKAAEVVEFTVDQIAEQMKIPAGEALARLLEWELTGEVQRIGSGRFVRSRSKV